MLCCWLTELRKAVSRRVPEVLQTKDGLFLLASKFLMSLQQLGILLSDDSKLAENLSEWLGTFSLNTDICAEEGVRKGAIVLFLYAMPIAFLGLFLVTIDVFGSIETYKDSDKIARMALGRGLLRLIPTLALLSVSIHLFRKSENDIWLYSLIISSCGVGIGLMYILHGSVGACFIGTDYHYHVAPGRVYFRRILDFILWLLEFLLPLLVSLWVRGVMREGLLAANILGGLGGFLPISYIFIFLIVPAKLSEPGFTARKDSSWYSRLSSIVFFSSIRRIQYSISLVGEEQEVPELGLKREFWAFNLVFLVEKFLITVASGVFSENECENQGNETELEGDIPEAESEIADFTANIIGCVIVFLAAIYTAVKSPYCSSVRNMLESLPRFGIVVLSSLHIILSVTKGSEKRRNVSLYILFAIIMIFWLILFLATPLLEPLRECWECCWNTRKKQETRQKWKNLRGFNDMGKILITKPDALSSFEKLDWDVLRKNQRFYIICFDREDTTCVPTSDLTELSLGSIRDIGFNEEVSRYGFSCLKRLVLLEIHDLGLNADDILALSESYHFQQLTELKTFILYKNSLQDLGCQRLIVGLRASNFNLTCLKLLTCGICEEATILSLIKYMNERKSVVDLYLDGNYLRDDIVRTLCEGLKENYQLDTLSLVENNLSDDTVDHFERLLFDNRTLRKVDLSLNVFFPQALERCRTFESRYDTKFVLTDKTLNIFRGP